MIMRMIHFLAMKKKINKYKMKFKANETIRKTLKEKI